MMMKRIFVTGSSGYIGKAFLSNACSKYSVKAFGRTPFGNGFEFVKGDVRNAEEVFRATQDVEIIMHLAAITPDIKNINDRDFFETNVLGTLNVLEAAARNKIKKIIYCSSVCAVGFGNGISPVKETDLCYPSDGMYGYSKYISERLCEAYATRYGMRIICLRLATVVPQHQFALPPNPVPPCWLAFVHIDDVLQALYLAVENESVSFDRFHIAPDRPHSRFDTSKAKSILGFNPVCNFDEYLPAVPLNILKKSDSFFLKIIRRLNPSIFFAKHGQ
jgi:nucleoside-diphosphate-sugar epimerase